MSYFTIETVKMRNGEETIFAADFQAVEFGIANAAFQALASRKDNDDVILYLVGNGEKRTQICNKEEWEVAQRTMRMQQMRQPPGVM